MPWPLSEEDTKKFLFTDPSIHVPIQVIHETLKFILTASLSDWKQGFFELFPTELTIPVGIKRSEDSLELSFRRGEGFVLFWHESDKLTKGKDTVIIDIHTPNHLHYFLVRRLQTWNGFTNHNRSRGIRGELMLCFVKSQKILKLLKNFMLQKW